MSICELLMFHNIGGIIALFLVMIPVLKDSKRWKMWFIIYAVTQLLFELNDLMLTAAHI